MSNESIVLLSIRESGTPAARSYAFTVLADGQILDSRTLTPVESREIEEISNQYRMLFDNDCRSKSTADYLEILGSGLFHLFFELSWGQIKTKDSGDKIQLVISSDIPDVLNLPWEIAQPPGGDPLGFDPRISILRLPELLRTLPLFEGSLPPGPLRVVFAACGPRQSMDYVSEEESFIKALEGLDVVWDSCDLGTFEELRQRVDNFRPQIVQLVGQGVVKDGQNYFAFEGSNGLADLRSSADIRKALSDVQLVFLSGCQSKVPSILANLGIELISAGLPTAVSWTGSITKSESAVRAFYREIVSGCVLEDAMVSMCQKIKDVHKSGAVLLNFPSIFSRTAQNTVFDPLQNLSVLPKPFKIRQATLAGTTEGYTENFVGRRRDQQRLVPALGESTVKAVVITGHQGSGKSTLAVRLARELEAEGFFIISLYSSAENPTSAARLLEALGNAFRHAAIDNQTLGRKDLAEKLEAASLALRDPGSSADRRLEEAVENLSLGHFLLILDGFDANLDESGSIKDPEVAQFYLMLLNNLGSSRAIITSERLPENAMTLPRKAWEFSLGSLTKADFIRYLRRCHVAAGYSPSDELTSQKLLQIYHQIDGLPQCLDEHVRALREANFVDAAANSRLGAVGAASLQSFCDEVTAWLYGLLSSDSQTALRKAAVYALPINIMGLVAVTGDAQERIKGRIEEWTDLALAFRTDGGLLAIRKELRTWIRKRLGPEELKLANKAAGDFLLEAVQEKTCEELGLTRLDCLLESRAYYLASGWEERARAATSRISSILTSRGLYGEVQRLNRELLVNGEHPEPIGWIARAFLGQGDFQHAEEWYRRCLQASEGSEKEAADAWQGIASVDLQQGRYNQAEENFQKALEIYRLLGDEKGEAIALQGLASIGIANGNHESARENLRTVLEIQKKIGDLRGQASTLPGLIAVELRLKNHASAREYLLESVEIFRKIDHPGGESAAIYDLASLDMEHEDFDSAKDEFQKALEIRQRIGDKAGEAAVLHSLAMIDAKNGEILLAEDKFKGALKIYQEIRDKSGEAAAFFQLGILAVRLNHITEGLRLLALSGIILRSIGAQEVRNVEQVVERMASQMKYTQNQFAGMVRVAAMAYRKDQGWGLVKEAFGNEG